LLISLYKAQVKSEAKQGTCCEIRAAKSPFSHFQNKNECFLSLSQFNFRSVNCFNVFLKSSQSIRSVQKVSNGAEGHHAFPCYPFTQTYPSMCSPSSSRIPENNAQCHHIPLVRSHPPFDSFTVRMLSRFFECFKETFIALNQRMSSMRAKLSTCNLSKWKRYLEVIYRGQTKEREERCCYVAQLRMLRAQGMEEYTLHAILLRHSHSTSP
jgi:hypothetical protein